MKNLSTTFYNNVRKTITISINHPVFIVFNNLVSERFLPYILSRLNLLLTLHELCVGGLELEHRISALCLLHDVIGELHEEPGGVDEGDDTLRGMLVEGHNVGAAAHRDDTRRSQLVTGNERTARE